LSGWTHNPPPHHPSERDRVVPAGPGGVRLRHLQSLHGCLEEARRGDWAQDVCTKYRAPLPPDLQVRGGGAAADGSRVGLDLKIPTADIPSRLVDVVR